MYEVRFLEPALRDLRRLDREAAKRVLTRLEWLRARVEEARAEPLKGELAGLFKLRVGDYRVLYEPLHGERLLVVHFVGHRREVYRR